MSLLPLQLKLKFYLALGLAPLIMGACATSKTLVQSEALPLEIDRIEGVWQLPDKTSYVRIERCKLNKAKSALCGRLIAFKGKPGKRDWLNSDLWAAGRKLCGAAIITHLHLVEKTGGYKGYIYAPSEGEQYHLKLEAVGGNKIVARAYMGASTDEFIDMAISAALGDPVGLFSGASLLTRASVGEKHLGETKSWHRVESAPNVCTN